MHHAWSNEVDLKNEDNLKNEEDLKNEDNLKSEHNLKNVDNLKNWSSPQMAFHTIDIIYAALPMCAQTEKTTFSCKDD